MVIIKPDLIIPQIFYVFKGCRIKNIKYFNNNKDTIVEYIGAVWSISNWNRSSDSNSFPQLLLTLNNSENCLHLNLEVQRLTDEPSQARRKSSGKLEQKHKWSW